MCVCVSTHVCLGKFVNAIICEIIDLASPNSVCGSLLARSRMSSYIGHIDLLSRSPQPVVKFLVIVVIILAFIAVDLCQILQCFVLQSSNMKAKLMFKKSFSNTCGVPFSNLCSPLTDKRARSETAMR